MRCFHKRRHITGSGLRSKGMILQIHPVLASKTLARGIARNQQALCHTVGPFATFGTCSVMTYGHISTNYPHQYHVSRSSPNLREIQCEWTADRWRAHPLGPDGSLCVTKVSGFQPFHFSKFQQHLISNGPSEFHL